MLTETGIFFGIGSLLCKYGNVLTFACKIASHRELGVGINVLQLCVLTFIIDIGVACRQEQLFGYRHRSELQMSPASDI